jgi:hypothetical protein
VKAKAVFVGYSRLIDLCRPDAGIETMTKRVRIQHVAGTDVRAEVPGDVTVDKLLPVILEQVNLPRAASDGRLLDYRLYYEDRPLRSAETLDSAGVTDDATLTVVSEAVFACFPPGTQITLADKRTTGIENIKAGDHVLSYDAERDRFETGAVKSVLADRALKYLVINGILRVTEPHLLYADGEWRPARDIRIGDRLATQAGECLGVSSISTEDVQGVVYNLHLESRSHTFFAEGILVHNADEKVAYGSAQAAVAEGADVSIAFDPSFSPEDVKGLLTALSDYYRACGGAGLELDFETQEASAREPVHA